jgi:glycosyltransferase involved in cell wall biosynthesis
MDATSIPPQPRILSGECGLRSAQMPYFSIGIPTYNRKQLLKQCLLSILKQTFTDFEVLIGNDYTQEPLSCDLLGIEDSRLRIVNHPHNLGEVGNMNALLQMSRSRYFTWQFDDDLYAPDFLESVYAALNKFGRPKCVYTSYGYVWGASFPKVTGKTSWTNKLFSGRQFIRMHLSGRLKILGCCGVFDTEYLRQIGGVQKFCDHPIGAHAEHFIAVRMGLLNQIAYINEPLVLYRHHGDSWSCKTKDADIYKQAGRNFIRASIKVLTEPVLRQDFEQNFADILKLSVNIVLGKLIARDGYLNKQELREYIVSLQEVIGAIKDPALYTVAATCLQRAIKQNRILATIKARFKSSAPCFLASFAYMIRALLSRLRCSA